MSIPKPLRTAGGIALITSALFLMETTYSAVVGPKLSFPADGKATGTFPERWIHGSKSAMDNTDPPLQIHAFNDHTYILRENKAINYEGVFIYLFFGDGVAMLMDQGSTSSPVLFPLRKTVDGIIDEWEKRFGQSGTRLIVANSHLHGDHYAAWNQFVDRPNTVMVGLTHEEMMAFWGFESFPQQQLSFDLGGREFIVTGSPGHQGSEISLYDKWTGLLYTGDMFYRGRLYLDDWESWAASIRRLRVIASENPVSHLVNNHIEMTREPGVDYPVGSTWHPNEPPMEMTVEMLDQAVRAADEITEPGIYKYDDFLVYNEIPWSYTTDK